MALIRHAIIGYTGFVGSNLLSQYKKKYKKIDLFNSKNISKISNKINYKSVFCAAMPATKWIINKKPSKDKLNTLKLIQNLKKIKTDSFILISTIDIYFDHVYGKNRKILEDFVKKKFNNYLIIRLPAIFGKGLKKNILYDLLNNNNTDQINTKDKFQWFDLHLLSNEIKKIKRYNSTVELYSPPILNEKITNLFPNYKAKKINRKKIKYDHKPSTGYYKNEKFILKRINLFIKKNAK